jgi:hypothetical protein
MPTFDERTLEMFHVELRKIAAPWQLIGRSVGSLGGAGAGIGATLGALHGAVGGYRDAREHGRGVGGSALSAIGGGVREGAIGGALGAGAGALAGGGAALAAPELAARGARAVEGAGGPIAAFGRFGQRQVHGLTGWTPEEGLSSIRGGAFGARATADAAQKNMSDVLSNSPNDRKAVGAAIKSNAHAGRAAGAAQELEDRGMTSLPGTLKAVARDPRGALAAGFKDQWHGAHPAMRAAMIGLPAIDIANTIMGPEDPHKGKAERIGGNMAGLAAGALLGGAPLAAQAAGALAAAPVGGLIGKGVDKLRGGLVHRKPELEPVDNQQHVSTERELSPAAAGVLPEV